MPKADAQPANTVQPGVEYPREIAAPEGLPAGWTAIEYAFKSGKSMGQTYIRFNSQHKKDAITSVKLAIKAQALYDGKSKEEAEECAQAFDREQAAKKLAQRKLLGFVEPEIRDEAIAAFRAKYGPLDGATTAKLPGWRAESIYRETCGQTAIQYFNPHGGQFGTVKQVEAWLGVRVLNGEDVPEVAQARSQVKYGEDGRPIHDARAAGPMTTRTADDIVREQEEKKRAREEAVTLGMLNLEKKNRIAGPECYAECAWLHALAIPQRAGGEGWAALEQPLGQDGLAIAEALVKQHGFVAPELLALQGCPKDHPHASCLSGVFHLKPGGSFNDRPVYQQIFRHASGPLACRGLYIYWSQRRSRWKLGPLDDAMAPYAYLPVDRASPIGGGTNGAASQWWVYSADHAPRNPPDSA